MPTFMGTSGERGKQSSHYLALLPAGTMFILTLQPKKLIQRGLGSLLKATLQGSTGPPQAAQASGALTPGPPAQQLAQCLDLGGAQHRELCSVIS